MNDDHTDDALLVVRAFGQPEADAATMTGLDGDAGVFSAIVGGVATEVRVPWRKDERGEVVALTGQRHVPVAVIDGDAICDSKRVVEHLHWRAEQSAS